MAELEINELPASKAIKATYEPGNGERYTIIAIPVDQWIGAANLGSISSGWIIINANNRLSYMFQKTGYLTPKYIAEKFHVYEEDAEHLAFLICTVTGRPTLR